MMKMTMAEVGIGVGIGILSVAVVCVLVALVIKLADLLGNRHMEKYFSTSSSKSASDSSSASASPSIPIVYGKPREEPLWGNLAQVGIDDAVLISMVNRVREVNNRPLLGRNKPLLGTIVTEAIENEYTEPEKKKKCHYLAES